MNTATPGSFLAQIGLDSWNYLQELGTPRSCEGNELLLRHGDPATHVLLIINGWTKIAITAPSGYEAVLAIRGPGDILGELAVLDGKPRSADVRTLCDIKAILLPADRFRAALETRPKIAIGLLSHLSGRLRRADNRRLEQAANSSTERLAALLLRLAEEHGTPTPDGTEISVRLSQQELAGAIGASREAVARSLRILRERHVVVTRRRRLVLTTPEVLISMAANVSFDAEEQF
ncbi:CRP-like cAMP-binding protein [Herbihabitans rhizosphaerae]|uniref:CRP-like cAMP-binding protein n=1 Tax=Herbihabitans rhizosphaerae TaxID=1872711 RepID=A0A4Q7L828_9PSEU|nr:Crp/Fnr family transcriptional regulator [Herbihabitans rhizosphaerae]RZS44801.1 CRP-like cAMP-binding protein [Herbihabitans rhizosphaerae]